MTSRLSNYLSSQKIAKLHLHSAQEYTKRGELQKAVGALTAAFEYMITANNNLASIAFNHKPKRASKPKQIAAQDLGQGTEGGSK